MLSSVFVNKPTIFGVGNEREGKRPEIKRASVKKQRGKKKKR